MSNYKAILIAIDLDKENTVVVSRGLALSNNQPHKLHIAHACEHPISGYGEQMGKNHCCTEVQIRQQVFPKLKALCDEYDIPSDNLHITFGRPSDAVHDLAEKIDADLIISGSHGKHGLQLLLGSTANSIVHGAKCDVLTVRV